MITPRVGLNLYVGSGIVKLGMTDMTKAVTPGSMTLVVFLMIVIHWLSLSRTLGMMG